MCTITISYDQNNSMARQQLEALLSSGLFEILTPEHPTKEPAIDYTDPWLYEDHGDLAPLSEGKEDFTPEELRAILISDAREIYGKKNAV